MSEKLRGNAFLPRFGLTYLLFAMCRRHTPQVRVGDADGVFERWVMVRAHPLGRRRFFTPRDHAAHHNAVQRRGSPGSFAGL